MNVEQLIKKLEKMPKDKDVIIIAEFFSDDLSATSPVKEVEYEGIYYDKVFIKGWGDYINL
jgi:hypothetical protein